MFSRSSITSIAIVTFMIMAFAFTAAAIDIECPIIADTLLAGHSSENNQNCGARESLRVKGYQGIVVFRFDMSPVQGLAVEGATFGAFCRSISGEATDMASTDAISTIAHDWIEGTGNYTVSEDSATYLWPGSGIAATWGEDDNEGSNRYGPIDVQDVINGAGGSIVNSNGVMTFRPGERTEIELDRELVQGLVDGSQYGIVLWRDTVGVNLDLASREWQGGANAATLVVHAEASAVDPGGKLAQRWGALKAMR